MWALARVRLRLTVPAELVQKPLLYHLVKDFDLVPNVRRADVGADHGWVVLELEGAVRHRVLAYRRAAARITSTTTSVAEMAVAGRAVELPAGVHHLHRVMDIADVPADAGIEVAGARVG